MKTSGITAALPAHDLGRAKAFYIEKVGLLAVESYFLKPRMELHMIVTSTLAHAGSGRRHHRQPMAQDGRRKKSHVGGVGSCMS